MTLEELVYSRLKGDVLIAGWLTKFNDNPAVFEIQAPSDQDKGWDKKKTYPRIIYATDKQENAERKVSGTLTIDVMTTNDGATGPEVIEEQVRKLLTHTFFEATNEPVVALVWNQTAAFEEDETVIGVTITFDMLAFPSQINGTRKPDPIKGIISYCKELYPTARLFDSAPTAPYMWTPTAQAPALYWRLTGVTTDQITNSVTWMTATIVGHLFAPTPSDRLPWIRQITEELATGPNIYMDDDSPLMLQRISADSSRDALKDGQITLTVRYGVLRTRPTSPALNNTNMTGAI